MGKTQPLPLSLSKGSPLTITTEPLKALENREKEVNKCHFGNQESVLLLSLSLNTSWKDG
jgi:hypothetical protein